MAKRRAVKQTRSAFDSSFIVQDCSFAQHQNVKSQQ